MDDFVFRFKIEKKNDISLNEEALIKMVKNNLKSILDIVELTFDEKVVKVDGFKFINNSNVNIKLF